ncbi:DUF3017 domain-containing protein [Ornithinimicrobium flavum]|uniref:DUF3017 domain-containing protein n=1 Tax=Ornithinimicrobium flavum TaxID=1288636 RepID=UPI00106F8B39|nr:DUF3017 domain-containing protein [Ornithinimicrobium flavum]
MSPDPGHGLDEELTAGRPGQRLGLWWLAVVGMVAAAVLLVTGGLRHYGYALGGTLVVLAVVRLVAPEERAGGLAVRGRVLDAATMLGLGVAVAVLAAYLRLG